MELTRNLSRGANGEDVKALQSALGLMPDGIFGPATEAATRDYQTAHKLAVDGVVGQITWASLMQPRGLPNGKLDAVARLAKFAGSGKYVLGAGGTNPNQATPFTWIGAQYGSDCIGAVMWALGCPRHHPDFPEYEGDINTDSALMDAGLFGDEGAGRQAFFAPLTGPMHPGVIVIYRSVWERDLDRLRFGKGAMVHMGHVGLIVGWTGLKNPERPQDNPWDHHLTSLITVECRASWPAVRLGQNVSFTGNGTVKGVTNPRWAPQFLTFHGPSI